MAAPAGTVVSTDVLMGLSPEERREMDALLEAEANVMPFRDFVRNMATAVQGGIIAAPHLDPLYDLIEQSRHREVRATISYPPRHGKSTTMHLGIAWRMVCDPGCLHMYGAFAQDLATEASHAVKKYIKAAGLKLKRGRSKIHDWRNKYDGGLKTTSVNGSITGRGSKGGLIVIDDWIKGRKQAESKHQRDQAWSTLTADVYSRAEEGASVIVPGTRWHVDDPIGRIIAGKLGPGWQHIVVPAIMNSRGEPVDERIDPDHRVCWPGSEWDLARFAGIRFIGEYDWWSLYQGMPRQKGTELFREPGRFRLSDFTLDGCRLIIACDPAATANTSSDASSIVVMAMRGYGVNTVAYILHRENLRETIPQLARRLRGLQQKWRGVVVAIEAVGGFKAIPQILRENAPADPNVIDPIKEITQAEPALRIHEITPLGDKFTRAQPVSGAWNLAHVLVPDDAVWAADYIEKMKACTGVGDAEDDDMDATAHGWNTLYRAEPVPRDRQYGSQEVDGIA